VATKIGTLKMRMRQTNGKVPGVDFTEHFARVINDITWRILLVEMMIWKLDVWLMDVETAFLHGEFDDGEQLFMDMPTGYDLVNADVNGRNDCIELMKTAYGTVQSARQFWKFMVNILNAIGFEGGDAAPCLMHWKSKLGIVFIGLYVDDCLCIGKPEALELKESKTARERIDIEDGTQSKRLLELRCEFQQGQNESNFETTAFAEKFGRRFRGDGMQSTYEVRFTAFLMPGFRTKIQFFTHIAQQKTMTIDILPSNEAGK
jgi:hypothetical protein